MDAMSSPSEIFEHVYLGSDRVAENCEVLRKIGIKQVLGVNDDENLIEYFETTFEYISKAQIEGVKLLVHCEKGDSSSVAVVIAYAIKAFNWNLSQALSYLKMKRNCMKLNCNLLLQLLMYQNTLEAMNYEKDTLQEKLVGDRTDVMNEKLGNLSGCAEPEENIERQPEILSSNVELAVDMFATDSAPFSQSPNSSRELTKEPKTYEELVQSSNTKSGALEQQGRNNNMPKLCYNDKSSGSVSQSQRIMENLDEASITDMSQRTCAQRPDKEVADYEELPHDAVTNSSVFLDLLIQKNTSSPTALSNQPPSLASKLHSIEIMTDTSSVAPFIEPSSSSPVSSYRMTSDCRSNKRLREHIVQDMQDVVTPGLQEDDEIVDQKNYGQLSVDIPQLKSIAPADNTTSPPVVIILITEDIRQKILKKVGLSSTNNNVKIQDCILPTEVSISLPENVTGSSNSPSVVLLNESQVAVPSIHMQNDSQKRKFAEVSRDIQDIDVTHESITWHRCMTCDRSYCDRNYYRIHVKYCSKPPVECPDCKKVLKAMSYTKHKRRCIGTLYLYCQWKEKGCEFFTKFRGVLKNHHKACKKKPKESEKQSTSGNLIFSNAVAV